MGIKNRACVDRILCSYGIPILVRDGLRSFVLSIQMCKMYNGFMFHLRLWTTVKGGGVGLDIRGARDSRERPPRSEA